MSRLSVIDKVMNFIHNNVMNYHRVTVSLPKNIYEDLLSLYGKGKISSVVAEAVEKKVLEKKLKKEDPVEEFLSLREKLNLPKLSDKEIFAAIRKGRM